MKVEEADKLSLQEACDYAVEKIVEQGERCVDNGGCRYSLVDEETGGYIHCAVGWLLDEEDDDLMDAVYGVGELADQYGDKVPKLIQDNLYTFRVLQGFHDARKKHHRVESVKQLSKYHNIDTSPPQYQQWVDMGEA